MVGKPYDLKSVLFKENSVHRVYGSYPAEYRIQTVPCQGVAAGAGGSLCLLGDADKIKTLSAKLKALGARGGGKPGSWQGSAELTEEALKALIAEVQV